MDSIRPHFSPVRCRAGGWKHTINNDHQIALELHLKWGGGRDFIKNKHDIIVYEIKKTSSYCMGPRLQGST